MPIHIYVACKVCAPKREGLRFGVFGTAIMWMWWVIGHHAGPFIPICFNGPPAEASVPELFE